MAPSNTNLFEEVIKNKDQPFQLRLGAIGMSFSTIQQLEPEGILKNDFILVQNENIDHFSIRIYFFEEEGEISAIEGFIEQNITALPDQTMLDDVALQLTSFYTDHFGQPEEIMEEDPYYGAFFERTWIIERNEEEFFITVMTYFSDQVESTLKAIKIILSA